MPDRRCFDRFLGLQAGLLIGLLLGIGLCMLRESVGLSDGLAVLLPVGGGLGLLFGAVAPRESVGLITWFARFF